MNKEEASVKSLLNVLLHRKAIEKPILRLLYLGRDSFHNRGLKTKAEMKKNTVSKFHFEAVKTEYKMK